MLEICSESILVDAAEEVDRGRLGSLAAFQVTVLLRQSCYFQISDFSVLCPVSSRFVPSSMTLQTQGFHPMICLTDNHADS